MEWDEVETLGCVTCRRVLVWKTCFRYTCVGVYIGLCDLTGFLTQGTSGKCTLRFWGRKKGGRSTLLMFLPKKQWLRRHRTAHASPWILLLWFWCPDVGSYPKAGTVNSRESFLFLFFSFFFLILKIEFQGKIKIQVVFGLTEKTCCFWGCLLKNKQIALKHGYQFFGDSLWTFWKGLFICIIHELLICCYCQYPKVNSNTSLYGPSN